jgi:outer membrane protein OmpA-like peptidoglycan-associated protein
MRAGLGWIAIVTAACSSPARAPATEAASVAAPAPVAKNPAEPSREAIPTTGTTGTIPPGVAPGSAPEPPTSLGTVVVADSDACGLLLDSIYFAPDSAVVRTDQGAVLDELARMFRCFYSSGEITRWSVIGSADDHERDPDRLAHERARMVARELVTRGVPAEALTASGVGATQPADPGQTPDDQARNRNVSFSVLVRRN